MLNSTTHPTLSTSQANIDHFFDHRPAPALSAGTGRPSGPDNNANKLKLGMGGRKPIGGGTQIYNMVQTALPGACVERSVVRAVPGVRFCVSVVADVWGAGFGTTKGTSEVRRVLTYFGSGSANPAPVCTCANVDKFEFRWNLHGDHTQPKLKAPETKDRSLRE